MRGIKLLSVLSVVVALPFFCSFSNIQHGNFSEENITPRSDFLCHSPFHIGNRQDQKGVTYSNLIHRYLIFNLFSVGEGARL